jgi:hypothetical protein
VRKLLAAGLAVVLVVGLIASRTRHRRVDEPRTPVPTAAAIDHEASHASAPAPAPAHVRKLATAEERTQVAQRIADARAARARAAGASATTSAPRLPAAAPGGIESLPPKTLDALKEAIPFLSQCFGSDSPRNPIVQMTLEGDPDVGTLIDSGQMTDEKGAPIAGPLADCLQTTLQSLELPPLAEGNTVRLQYSFRL